jgi:hypothetical protein
MVVLIRLLILVVLVLLVWKLARDLFGARRRAGSVAAAGSAPEFEPTARCAACGTHVPRTQLDAAGKCPQCRK